jgi:hypothetical protein
VTQTPGEAGELIHTRTGGVPRLINQVCDTALVYAFGEQRTPVDMDIVADVINDRRAGGLLGLSEPAASRQVIAGSLPAANERR